MKRLIANRVRVLALPARISAVERFIFIAAVLFLGVTLLWGLFLALTYFYPPRH
jgi:hypothetical protein